MKKDLNDFVLSVKILPDRDGPAKGCEHRCNETRVSGEIESVCVCACASPTERKDHAARTPSSSADYYTHLSFRRLLARVTRHQR